MDPKVALDNARTLLARGDVAEALQSLLGYYHWRVGGGFEPNSSNCVPHERRGDQLAATLAARIVDAVENFCE